MIKVLYAVLDAWMRLLQVILNTMFEMDQGKYDRACPENFQSAGTMDAMHRLHISPSFEG